MALHHGGHAQRHRQPVRKAGLIPRIDAVQAEQHQREERHGGELAHSSAGVDADKPIAGQCVEHCPQQPKTAALSNAAKAEISDQAGGQCDCKDVYLIAGAQRQPQIVQQCRQKQKQLTIAKRVCIAVTVQGGGSQAYRKLPVGKLGCHSGDALQMVVQIVADIKIIAEQRQTG